MEGNPGYPNAPPPLAEWMLRSGSDGADVGSWHGYDGLYTPASVFSASPPVPESLPKSQPSVTVSVSTIFFPGAPIDFTPSDVLLVSEDGVHFYVHAHRISAASSNHFGDLLRGPDSRSPVVGSDNYHQVINLPENSASLNVTLHAMYGLSASAYTPSFDVLSNAVAAFPKYGIDGAAQLAPTSPLYPLVIGFAPLHPIEVYTIAAENQAHDLAVNCSPHLLSFDLSTLGDDMAARIGSVYLKRLFFLHLGRSEALKPLLLPTPQPHPETPTCTFEDQRTAWSTWAMATASLAWEARPDISAGMLEATLSPPATITCQLCRESMVKRIEVLVTRWSLIKRTI